MNPPARSIRFVACLTLVGAAGALLRQSVCSLHRTEASLATMNAAHASLQKELKQSESLLATKLGAQLAWKRDLEKLTAPRVPTPPPAIKPTPAPTTAELMVRDPRLRVLYLDWQRAVQTQEYFPLFQQLGLSPEQQDKFIANLLAGEERRMDLADTIRSPESATGSTLAAARQQAQDQIETAQNELLGPDGYQRYRDFVRTLPLRNTVALSVAGTAALAGIPLTREQGEQLFQSVLGATRPDPKSGEPDLATIDWAAVDAQAQLFLSPAQFALLKTVAPNSGFPSRADLQLQAAMAQALDQDRRDAAATGASP
jgi:hypothetical protein